MRIAQIVSLAESVPPTSKNGLEFIASWLTEELVKRGHKVTLFASADSKTKAQLLPIFPNSLSKEDWHVWHRKNYSDWNTAYAASLSDKFDIIHSHTGTIVHFMPFIKKPVVYTVHEPYNDNFRKKYLSSVKYRRHLKFITDQYKKINYITVSKNQEKEHSKCTPYYFKKHTTIYNGIPIKDFIYNSKPDNYLLYIGYINKEKGADIAVKVAKKLKMKLILAGSIQGKENFFNKEIKPYLNKDIKYIGVVNFKQKVNLFKNALCSLAPISWSEPFGLVIAESQACGTPVISFNKGASKEIIKNNETGFIVENEKEMIATVKKIDTINRLDCRRNIEDNFSIETMVNNYERYYERIIKKS